MTKCMSYQEGEIYLAIKFAKSRSILREYLRSSNPGATQISFFMFSTRILTIYAFIGSVSRGAFNEHRKSELMRL